LVFGIFLVLMLTACYDRGSNPDGAATPERGKSESPQALRENSTNAAAVKGGSGAQGSSAQGSGAQNSALGDTTTKKVPFHTKIHLYIENSGSMNGYVNGNTAFKNMLGDLLVNLKYEFGAHNI